MRFATALAAAVALFAAVALSGAAVEPVCAQASAHTWNELFTLDCSGKLYAMSSSGIAPVAVDVSLIRQVFDFWTSTYASRIRCRCPNIQPAEMAEYFGWTIQTVLRWAEPKLSVQLPECSTPGTRFVHTNLFPGDTWDFVLPETCTAANYPSAGCKFSMPLGSGSGMTVNIAISQCPAPTASNLPYISVTCSGLHCADFGRPCASAADCAREPTTGALTPCDPVTTGSGDYTSVTRMLHDGLVAAGLFARTDSCSTGDGTHVDDSSVGTWAYNQLQSMLSAYLGGAATGSQNTVCGIDWVQNDWPNAFSGICSAPSINGVTVVDCSTSAWDGTLYDGATNAFDANRMADFGSTLQQNQPQLKRGPWPVDPSGNGVHNVMTFGCDDSFGGLMTDPVLQFSASVPPLHAAYTALMNSVQQLELCRTSSAPLTPDQVDARFNFGSLLPFLVNLTQHPATAFALGAPISDLWSYQYALWSGNGNFMNGVTMNMPAGCQLSDWLTTGTCRFEFTGLSTLVNRDIRLRFQLQKCPAATSKSLFSAIVDCVGGDGTDCADVMQPYAWDYCEQDSDCSGGRTCNAMGEWVPYPPWVASALWLTAVNVYKVQVVLKSTTDPFKYARMTYAQQTAVAQALAADIALALNTQFALAPCVYGPCVPQPASQFQAQGFYVANSDNSFSAQFTILPGGTMTPYQLLNQLLLMSSAGHGPPARYAYLNDSTQITQSGYTVQWFQCPDGSYQPDQTYCNPQDQCDLQGQAQIDAINLMRVLRGLPQLTHLNPQYSHHGFCAISVQNISNAYSWWQSQFSETYDAAGHPILSLAGLVPFEMPDPNNPNCYTNCQSDAQRTAAAASAPFVVLCAALLAWRS